MNIRSKNTLSGQIRRALQHSIQGDCHFDEYYRAVYSTAACIFRIQPLGVVMPRDGDDLVKIVRIASELNIPLTARGAGVGLTGGALGSGIIVDFARYMNRILSIDAENRRVRLEPGVVLQDLDSALKRFNLFFPPDPSSRAYCTLGGMVGNNAAGPHSIKYGSTRNYITSIGCVMSDGSETQFPSRTIPNSQDSAHDDLSRKLLGIVKKYEPLFLKHMPKTTKNSSGYLIDHILNSDGSMNLTNLLAASEGTLALFTEFELRVEPLPVTTGVSLLFFDSLYAAGEAVVRISSLKPSMLEIMEETFVRLVRDSGFRPGIAFPSNLQVMILVEFEAGSEEEIRSRLDELDRLSSGFDGLISVRRGKTENEKEQLLKVRNAASPILNRYPPPLHPVRFIEDGVVPVDRLPAYISGLHRIFSDHDVHGVIFGHAGDGNVHVNPFMDLRNPDFKDRMAAIARDTVSLVRELNGSLTGEHGDGLLRSPYLPEMFGPVYEAFKEIKQLFDPQGIFNPGKIAGNGRLRKEDHIYLDEPVPAGGADISLKHEQVLAELAKCGRCGVCRSYCPSFLASREEIATPRSKLNLVHLVLTQGRLSAHEGVGPVEKSFLDLCINCGTCLVECPSGVDVPLVIQRAKQAYGHSWGLPVSDRLTSHPDIIGRAGTLLPGVMNSLLKNRLVRRILQELIGIDAKRKLPPFSKHRLEHMSWNEFRSDGHTRYRTVFFPGCFSVYNDAPGEGAAILAVLLHHSIYPFIPDSSCCGVAQMSIGDLDGALKNAVRNIEVLLEFAQQEYFILTGSPSCGLAIKIEYPRHLQTPQSRRVSERTLDIHEFLIRLLRDGQMDTAFRRLNYRIAVHQPCHLRSQGIGDLPEKLLRLIPGLDIHALAPKCCGMAGSFGTKAKNFDFSMKIGQPLFREIKRILPDVIVSGCGACRMQLEQATGIPSVHPVSLLAEAYGLLNLPLGLGIFDSLASLNPFGRETAKINPSTGRFPI